MDVFRISFLFVRNIRPTLALTHTYIFVSDTFYCIFKMVQYWAKLIHYYAIIDIYEGKTVCISFKSNNDNLRTIDGSLLSVVFQ